MGMYRVALFVSYLCLLKCDLYQARAFDKEKTTIRLQIPLNSLTLYTDSNKEGAAIPCNTNNCKNGKMPSGVMLTIPPSSLKGRKTNIMVDMTGKNKGCTQYSSKGLPKNEILTVDVFVNDNQNTTNNTQNDGYLTTASNSSIEDSKAGMRVIGSSVSSTADSNLTVFVKVYLIHNDTKQTSDEPTIITNSIVSDGNGDVADADTDAEVIKDGPSSSGGDGDGSSMGSGDGGSSGTDDKSNGGEISGTKENIGETTVGGSSDDDSSAGGSSGGSTDGDSSGGGLSKGSSGGSSDDGSSYGGSSGSKPSGIGPSDGGASNGDSEGTNYSSGESTNGGSSGGKSTGSDASGGGSTDGGSSSGDSTGNDPPEGGLTDGGSSSDDSTGSGSSGGKSTDGVSPDSTSPENKSAAASAAGAASADGAGAAAAAAAAASKNKDADAGSK